MQRIPLRPSVPVLAVALQHACEERLGRRVAGVVGRAGELVEGEGEREEG